MYTATKNTHRSFQAFKQMSGAVVLLVTTVWDYPDGATTAAAGQLRMMRGPTV